jgi:DNA-binding transcriptional ArsR family regulator
VARTGKSRATVSRHLKRLSEYGLAFSKNQQDGSTRWWRYRVNPDLVAERHGVPDTAQLKAAKHQAQRRRYWQRITSARDDGGVVRGVHRWTGSVHRHRYRRRALGRPEHARLTPRTRGRRFRAARRVPTRPRAPG